MFHCDNAYRLPAVELTGYVCRTNKTSQTAFRGFGGPQGMVVIEEILDQAARRLSLPPELVRERNFYREGDTTHYGQAVKDAGRIETIWHQLKESSGFDRRREEIERFNSQSRHTKRGLAITPAKFGISFTATFFNQAGALVLIYRDGTVQVNHGGTEMGQGLHTKIQQIAAESLGLPLEAIRVMPTRTDKIPNTSATAASASTDLNGAAVVDACAQLKQRLATVAAGLLACGRTDLQFSDGRVFHSGDVGHAIPFARVCEAAYRQRIALFAQGYYRTPGDSFRCPRRGGAKPFHYFAYGAAVSEVEVDAFTGDYRLLRVDILEDAGDSVSPLVDRGQIEGGFIQGVGWLTLEELVVGCARTPGHRGRVDLQAAVVVGNAGCVQCRIFFSAPTEPGVVFGSKAVGEPPLMLAISVREAIRAAVAAFGDGGPVTFASPATPERVFFAVRQRRALHASR